MKIDTPKKLKPTQCENCWKEEALCFCDSITPQTTSVEVAVLQHPQEALKPLSTARLLSLSFTNASHRVGLSWRGLDAVTGTKNDMRKWAVLYLGSLKETAAMGDDDYKFTAKGKESPKSIKEIKGLVVLDGNWKQAKALWWRNPWLNRLSRLQINPETVSLYGSLRREPRKAALSTIEAVAHSLPYLGVDVKVAEQLTSHFSELLRRVGTRQ